MDFYRGRGRFVYGFVRGTSMWPGLIPGDVLRAERIAVGQLGPGDIVVLPRGDAPPLVHRILTISEAGEGRLEIRTAGDRSGPDTEPIHSPPGEELLRVIGVLRRGAWESPRGKARGLWWIAPSLVIRIHALLVRKFEWGAPRGIDRGLRNPQ